MSVTESSRGTVINCFFLPGSSILQGGSIYDMNVGNIITKSWIAEEDTWSAQANKPPGHRHVSLRVPPVLVYKERVSEREQSPFDDPPGLGYKALKAQNAFIMPKNLWNRTVLVENGLQLVRTSVTTQYGNMWDTLEFNFDNPGNIWNVNIDASNGAYGQYFNDLRNKAILNLYASLAKRQKINGGVMLAELKESMGLLGKACTTLMQIIHAVKRGRVQDAIKLIKEYSGGRIPSKILTREQLNRQQIRSGKKPITKSEYTSSTWLELQFGWLPIVSDIYSIIDYISTQNTTSEKGPWLAFSGYASGSFEGEADTSEFQWASSWYGTINSAQSKDRVAVTAIFSIESPVKDVLNQIGLLNPASIAWETVPFSFVLDWFLPVGNWIQSFTAYSGLELQAVHTSVKSDVTVTLASPSRPYWIGPVEDIVLRKIEFKRVVYAANDPELPPFPVAFASLEKVLQPWKLITSLALFRQLRR